MKKSTTDDILALDRAHVWHPYTKMASADPVYPVTSAEGVYLTLKDGRRLIDGMSSWWCAIHGYNHPVLVNAIKQQAEALPHVMFGGLTHEPAVRLAKQLVTLSPDPLQHVFFSDSGSVAVEVAIKMALQYWHARGKSSKRRLLTVRSGYHGDTFGAMGVCDPITGMHHLFGDALPKQFFAPAPECQFSDAWDNRDIEPMAQLLQDHHEQIAAVILEPVVQGAGGMRFYSPQYLVHLKALCDQFSVLLIFDEIATGFGRTGKLFACEHAGITPDIMCLGKALTGGYMSFAATLTTKDVSSTIDSAPPFAFMHGPTFMGNPLACATALASIGLLQSSNWQQQVADIERGLETGLAPARELPHVTDVRALGAIGVIESATPVTMRAITEACVNRGIWVRPFGKLVYLMPPFIISTEELQQLCTTLIEVVRDPSVFH